MRSKGFALAELLAALVILGIIACLLLPVLARARRQEKVDACAHHLKTLHQAQQSYCARAPQAPFAPGKAYWRRLTQGPEPLIAPTSPALQCPVREQGEPADDLQYFGPGRDPDQIADADPIGCDEGQNHSPDGREGGNILRKSGHVETDNTGLWQSAFRGGACRP